VVRKIVVGALLVVGTLATFIEAFVMLCSFAVGVGINDPVPIDPAARQAWEQHTKDAMELGRSTTQLTTELHKIATTPVGGPIVVTGMVSSYLLPWLVAVWRRRQSAAAILALNGLLGWTFIGWVVALVWALTGPRGRQGASLAGYAGG
jgi:hypothetical protein